jgi:multiple sugar transport system substrate-binding protein/raffinose/stachyose/melibiose transport system substrate-binding protein
MMRHTHRLVNLAVMVSLIAVFAVQCTSPATTATPAEAAPVELTYVSFIDGTTLADPVSQTLIDQFKATHPNIQFSRSSAYVGDNPPPTYLNGSLPPDLLATAADYITFATIDQGLILSLDEMWTQSGLDDVYPANFQALRERGGKQYFLPIGYTWVAIYYNKHIFEQYDLQPPTTWEEFLAVCDTLLANGVPPVALGWYDFIGATWWFDYLDLRLNGPEFHAELVQGQARYDDTRIRRVFEAWGSLLDDGYFTAGADSRRLSESLNLVLEEKAAMILCDSAEVGGLPAQSRNRLDFFAFPIMDPDVPVGEVARAFGYAIPAGALHRSEAREFLVYVTSMRGRLSWLGRCRTAVSCRFIAGLLRQTWAQWPGKVWHWSAAQITSGYSTYPVSLLGQAEQGG